MTRHLKQIMQNYIGIGVDAKVALEWHRTRQLHPHRFTSVLRNKIRYARYGAQHLFALRGLLRRLGLDREARGARGGEQGWRAQRGLRWEALPENARCGRLRSALPPPNACLLPKCLPAPQIRPHAFHPTHAPRRARTPQERDFSTLCSQLTIEADGVPVTLPPGTEGVIILNIPSYGGGSDLWGAELGDLWNADPEDPAGATGVTVDVTGVTVGVAVGVAVGVTVGVTGALWNAEPEDTAGEPRRPSFGRTPLAPHHAATRH